MTIKKVILKNFRNIGEIQFEPSSHLNFFIGLNGQGKTSILEALGLIATFKSFRSSQIDELIKFDEDQSDLMVLLKEADVNVELKVSLHKVDRGPNIPRSTYRIASINGKTFKSSTSYLTQRFGSVSLGFHTVVFQPADHFLIRGGPSERRGYLDKVIIAENLEYLSLYQKYSKYLEHRNALLKKAAEGRGYDRSLLESYSEPLAEYGAKILTFRLEWFNRLSKYFANSYRLIDPKNEPPKLYYYSDILRPKNDKKHPAFEGLDSFIEGYLAGHDEPPSLELFKQRYQEKLYSLSEIDRRQKATTTGPHRDDWMFFLGDRSLKGFGSQGETRTALLALKISEIESFQTATGQKPVLLLDDFSSELDQKRRAFLLEYLRTTDLQVFVTSTEDQEIEGQKYLVSNGKLELKLQI